MTGAVAASMSLFVCVDGEAAAPVPVAAIAFCVTLDTIHAGAEVAVMPLFVCLSDKDAAGAVVAVMDCV